jgi:hypothetical protein
MAYNILTTNICLYKKKTTFVWPNLEIDHQNDASMSVILLIIRKNNQQRNHDLHDNHPCNHGDAANGRENMCKENLSLFQHGDIWTNTFNS